MREQERRFIEEVLGRVLMINIGNLPMFIYKSTKRPGYIISYYLDISASDKVGDVAAVCGAVKSKEEFLRAKLTAVTSWAEKIGLKPGMQVKRAIKILEEYK
ncbi:MAG: DUF1805 domain-containing protein [Candidatus Anstonellales archaeon]